MHFCQFETLAIKAAEIIINKIIRIYNVCVTDTFDHVWLLLQYKEFKFQNRYINFYQFEIFAIKAAEKQRK